MEQQISLILYNAGPENFLLSSLKMLGWVWTTDFVVISIIHSSWVDL